MKNQKGITLMILVVTILIMSLIFGAIAYNSVTGHQLNAYYMMCSDIELLDEKIALYYLENKELPIQGEVVSITDLISDYSSENVNYNPNNSTSGLLYKIDTSQLSNLSLRKTEYYIDAQSHTIYSLNGRRVGNDIYYTVPTDYQKVDLTLYQ